MAKRKRSQSSGCREFALQMGGRHVAVSVESMPDGSVQVGFSIATISQHEFIFSEETDVALISDKGNRYNCWWRVPPGVLPVLEFGLGRTAAAGFKFHPIRKSETPDRLLLSFRDSQFELDVGSDRYRTDHVSAQLPDYFPADIAAKYDRQV